MEGSPQVVFGLGSVGVRKPPVARLRHLLRFIKMLGETRGVLTSDGVLSRSARSALTSRGVSHGDSLTGTAAVESHLGAAHRPLDTCQEQTAELEAMWPCQDKATGTLNSHKTQGSLASVASVLVAGFKMICVALS